MLDTVTRLAKVAFAWLKGVPASTWAGLALLIALWAVWSRNRWKGKAQLIVEQGRVLRDYQVKVQEIRERRTQAIRAAQAKHETKDAELQATDKALVDTAGDVDAIADAVNDAFGKAGDDA
jgi:hypothetical protein